MGTRIFAPAATMAAIAVVMVLAAAVPTKTSAQPACASKLAACAQYLNVTGPPPPETCCGPLKEALTNELSCLCAIYKSPEILKAFGIDLNQSLQLPKRCGLPASYQNTCNITTAAGPPTNAPPATPGSDTGHAAHGATWFGMSGLMSLCLFWWSIML